MMNQETEVDELAPGLIIAITLIGGFIRILLLGIPGLTLDETYSVWLANHSLTDLTQWVARIDYHPPLYYLLLHAWISLKSDTPNTVRLLSALFGTATIPVIYWIGRRLSGAAVGLAAAVLLAFSPFHIRFAQFTSVHTLLTFNAAVAIYALVRLLTDPCSALPIGSQFRQYLRAWLTPRPAEPDPKADFSYRDMVRDQSGWRGWIYRHRLLPIQAIATDLAWVAFIVSTAATMLTHNLALLFPAATNIFILGLMLYRRIKKPASLPTFQVPSFSNWVKAQLGILLLWSPWLPSLLKQTGRVFQESSIPKPTLNTVLEALRSFVNEPTINEPRQILFVWILLILLFGLGLVYFRKQISRIAFLAALIAIPFLGELIVSLRQPVFISRTLIWVTIPIFLILGAGIVHLRFRFAILAVLGLVGTINLFYVTDYFRFSQHEDWAHLAGFVANFVQKDDLVLFSSNRTQIPFDYYFKPYEDQYSLQVEKHGLPVDIEDSHSQDPKMEEGDIQRLAELLSGHNRVWLVSDWYTNTDPSGLISQTLVSQMQLVQKRDFYAGQVQFYVSP